MVNKQSISKLLHHKNLIPIKLIKLIKPGIDAATTAY